MIWASDWAWGVPLLVLTIAFHVSAFMLISRLVVADAPLLERRPLAFIISVALLALCAVILHSIEALAWAALYVRLGALPNLSDAMLYSLEAVTSYGHAEIFLEQRWRLLGAIEAVNGLILFGLTTAFFFAAIQKAWPTQKQ